MLVLHDLAVKCTLYSASGSPQKPRGTESGVTPTNLIAVPERGLPEFAYGSAANRKGGMEDLATSQYFQAKQLT